MFGIIRIGKTNVRNTRSVHEYGRITLKEENSMKRRMICTVALVVGIVGLFTFCVVSTVSAKEQPERVKLVTSVEIQPGDTLWGIASRYMSEEFGDVSSYVAEIKRCNHLYEDSIQAGQCIVVPYYKDAV